jgi:hypothetical protein
MVTRSMDEAPGACITNGGGVITHGRDEALGAHSERPNTYGCFRTKLSAAFARNLC